MGDNILSVAHLSKSFGNHTVLSDIDFAVNTGDVTSIIGASGSGKSTLLRCINLLETPSGGDILYHGPRNDLPRDYAPKAVIEILNNYADRILCVRGNCDTEVDQMVLQFPIMADYAVICEKCTLIYATHGHNYNCDKLPPITKGDILLHGHTHIPACDINDKCIYLNPGSVSIPKKNSHHGYMTLCDGIFLWKDFEGNVINQYSIFNGDNNE